MNLFILIPYTPTPIRTRPYNLVRSLVARGHRVTLATVWEDETERQALAGWQAQGVRVLAEKLSRARKLWNLVAALPGMRPLQSGYCWVPRLMKTIQADWLQQAGQGVVYDAIHVEHLRGSLYALALQAWLANSRRAGILATQPPIIWDSVDCISLLFAKASQSSRSRFGRLAATIDLPRTRRFEGWLARQFCHTVVTAEADRAALADLAENRTQGKALVPEAQQPPITVLPNGVDLDVFAPNYGTRHENTIVLTGKMSYHANVTAAMYLVEEVMPVVWESRPQVVVQLVGANPPAEIRALAERYPGKVTVTGTVPDVAPYLQQATLAAAPIAYGVGIQNKVLEAMACATPVVCTPQAVSALRTRTGEDLLVGGTAREFAGEVLRLLGDPDLRQSVGKAGRAYVEKHHSWQAIAAQLEEIYRSACKR